EQQPSLVQICNYSGVPDAPDGVSQNACFALLSEWANISGQAGLDILEEIQFNGYQLAYLADARTTNLGGATVEGIDIKVSYYHPFDWGSMDLSFNGTWRLKDESRFMAESPVIDGLANFTS